METVRAVLAATTEKHYKELMADKPMPLEPSQQDAKESIMALLKEQGAMAGMDLKKLVMDETGCSRRTVERAHIAKKSVQVDVVHTPEDEWAAQVAINDALLELRRHGGGPVHINLVTTYSPDFSVRELPQVKGIRRYFVNDEILDVCIALQYPLAAALSLDECPEQFRPHYDWKYGRDIRSGNL